MNTPANLKLGDLKTIIDTIELMLTNERQTYNIKFNEAKMRLPTYIKRPIFRDLYTKVSPFALSKILPQYLKVIDNQMLPCTKHFTTTIGLPCAYIIERRMLEAGGVLKIEDIHPHWRFKKPTQSHDQQGENEENSNADSAAAELLRVNELATIALRGRPPGARNKRTRAQAFEDST